VAGNTRYLVEAVVVGGQRPKPARQVRPDLAELALPQELTAAGDDAGPQSIAHHLAVRVEHVPSVTTI